MAKELDEATQKVVDRHVAKSRKDTAKLALDALKDAKPDTDGLDRATAKAVKDHHKSVVDAVKASLA